MVVTVIVTESFYEVRRGEEKEGILMWNPGGLTIEQMVEEARKEARRIELEIPSCELCKVQQEFEPSGMFAANEALAEMEDTPPSTFRNI